MAYTQDTEVKYMAIPKTNKPAGKAPSAAKTPATEIPEELAAKLEEEAAKLAKTLKNVNEQARKVEKTKVEEMYNAGGVVNDLMTNQSDKIKKKIVERLATVTTMSTSFFYLAAQFSSIFTDEECKGAVSNGLSARVVKVLVTIKDSNLRAKMLKKAVEEGLSADDIRAALNTKNARAVASKAKAAKSAATKPPFRVFTQASDRADSLSQSIGFSTEAIARISKVSEDDKATTIDTLVTFRSQIESIVEEGKAFLKHTKSLVAKK